MQLRAFVFALSVFAVGLVGCNGNGVVTPENQLLVRKEVQQLSQSEVNDFVATLKTMKTVPSAFDPTVTAYDWFVRTHLQAFSNHDGMHGAHGNPDFLPWHREFLRRFESEMRRVSGNPNMTLPYWDWTQEGSTQRLFQNDFMGGDGNPDDSNWVDSGPFRKGEWPIVFHDPTEGDFGDDPDPVEDQWLVRNIGGDGISTLPTEAEVDAGMNVGAYDQSPYNMQSDIQQSFRNYVEGWWPSGSKMHNQVHVYIAGNMASMASPNDPLFFLHHANVDRIWAMWQARHGNSTFPESYMDEDLMFFGILPQSMFDLRAQGVRYSSMTP